MPPLSNWLKFKVRTLDKNQLSGASAELVAIMGAFKPDVVIGIRSGGYKVAETMIPYFPHVPLLPITCRRPTTKKKQKSSLLKSLLRKLPQPITSRLRIIEHIILTQLRPPQQSVFTPDKDELTVIENYLRQYRGKPNILIVDDAVDSGSTLAAVVNAIAQIAGAGATIKTAVITVTTASPFVEPNFILYRYVLCRFPWSLDFKN
jgi:hypoxanthine phosphoribosyltransferase